MIILERKKILYTIGIITMFIFTYMITGYNVGNSKKTSDELDIKTVHTVALPVNNKVIVLDARTSEYQTNGAESSTRYYRGRKQFKNCFKSAKFIRTIRCNSNPNQK